MTDLPRQLDGYRLTTAEINYWRPDHPSVLQQYIWQELDMAPRFPVLTRFLRFWEETLDGRLHMVRVATSHIIQPSEFRFVDGMLKMH